MAGNSLGLIEDGVELDDKDSELIAVLIEAWKGPFTTRCDLARDNAEVIAIASHHRLITTATAPSYSPGEFGSQWRLTPKGMEALWRWKG